MESTGKYASANGGAKSMECMSLQETIQYKTNKVVDEVVIRKAAVSALKAKILDPWSEYTKPASRLENYLVSDDPDAGEY